MASRFAQMLLIFAFALPACAGRAGELNSQAQIQMARGSWDDARRLYLELHGFLQKVLGPEHPQTVLALVNACDASVPLAARYNSIPLCTRALDLQEKLTPESIAAVKTMSDLALLYAAQGDLSHSSKLLERALRITGDAPSPEAAGVMNNLGTLYYKKRKYYEARDMFERAIAIVGNGVMPDGSDLLTMLGNLGGAELALHDAPAAELHFRRALSVAQNSFGPGDAKYIKAAKDLSRAQAALRNNTNTLTSSAAMP